VDAAFLPSPERGRLPNKGERNGEKIPAADVFVLEWHENGKLQYRALTADPDDAARQLRTQQVKLEGVDVCGLDVPMDDPLGVSAVECIGNLDGERQDKFGVQWPTTNAMFQR